MALTRRFLERTMKADYKPFGGLIRVEGSGREIIDCATASF